MSRSVDVPRVAWLSERLLLMTAGLDGGGDGDNTKLLVGGSEGPLPLDVESFECPVTNGSEPATVSICRLPATFTRDGAADLAVRIGDESLGLHSGGPSAPPSDLTTILRTRLAGLSEPTRQALLRFIVNAAGDDLRRPGWKLLAKKLVLIREVLRERLPYCTVREDQLLGLHVDGIHMLDERTFWFKGWVWDTDAPLATLTFMSPEGCTVEVLGAAYRYPRGDIEDLYGVTAGPRPDSGFLARAQLDVPSRLPDGWIAQLRNVLGVGVEVEGPAVTRNPSSALGAIVRDFNDVKQAPRERLVVDHMRPAVASLQSRIAEEATVERVEQYGDVPPDPDVSLVISLGTNHDALEQQLVNFGHDPEVAAAEIIYVLDSRDTVRWLVPKAAELHWLYEIPFRLVSLSQRAGSTAMANAGAALATAPNLMFLGPDVIPDSPGWVGEMLAFKAATPDAGALGPMLLYEDGSVQHAGIHFAPVSPQEMGLLERREQNLWELRFPFKGYAQGFAGAEEGRPVPAVSSACLLVESQLFEHVGGFRNLFLQGDFAAVDLCLRLSEAGRTNWYVPSATLHHLEGRSRPQPSRAVVQYDVMVHSQVWGERIGSLVAG